MMHHNPFAIVRSRKIKLQAARRKAELRARHDAGPGECLSEKHLSEPWRPQPLASKLTISAAPIPDRRPHRKSGKPPSGRPTLTGDIVFGKRVSDMVRAGTPQAQAVKRVAATLVGIQPRTARERVYRSLARYRAYRGNSSGEALATTVVEP